MGILNAISTTIGMNGTTTTGMLHPAMNAQIQGSSVHYPDRERPRMKNKTLFSGRVEVQQVCNGYIVNIATREGYEFDTHIAATVKEVNEIISTAIVAFQLEA
jgi:hypothetical protein